MPKRGGKKVKARETRKLTSNQTSSNMSTSYKQSNEPPNAKPKDKQRKSFLDFPREVRDKIYEETLVLRPNAKDQLLIDRLNAPDCPLDEFQRNCHLDAITHSYYILPGRTPAYPTLWAGLGLLLANKQIHEEATIVMFSQNTFLIETDGESRDMFWHCGNGLCNENWPCRFHVSSWIHMKHLHINVRLENKMDKYLQAAYHNLGYNLHSVVRCLATAPVKLETLSIRFTSLLGGQIEAVRDQVEKQKETVPIRDCHGKVVAFNMDKFPMLDQIKCVFIPFGELEHKPQTVTIRGDLSQACIDKLVQDMQTKTPHLAAKRKQARTKKAEAEAKPLRAQAQAESGLVGFLKEMIKKNPESPDNDGMRRLIESSKKLSLLSPALKVEMMSPMSAMMGQGRAGADLALLRALGPDLD